MWCVYGLMTLVRLERCCIKRFLFWAPGAAFAVSAMYLPFRLRHVLPTQRHLSSLPCFSLCSILLRQWPSRIDSLTFASPPLQDLEHHFLKLSWPRRKLAASEPHRRSCGPRLCARSTRLKSPNRPNWTSPAWIVLAYYCLAHSFARQNHHVGPTTGGACERPEEQPGRGGQRVVADSVRGMAALVKWPSR